MTAILSSFVPSAAAASSDNAFEKRFSSRFAEDIFESRFDFIFANIIKAEGTFAIKKDRARSYVVIEGAGMDSDGEAISFKKSFNGSDSEIAEMGKQFKDFLDSRRGAFGKRVNLKLPQHMRNHSRFSQRSNARRNEQGAAIQWGF